MTKYLDFPIRAEALKLPGTPPIRKPGERPEFSRIQAIILVTVVFPCVPETAITWRPGKTSFLSHSGPDMYGILLVNTNSTHSFPRESALPIRTKSGFLRRLSAE